MGDGAELARDAPPPEPLPTEPFPCELPGFAPAARFKFQKLDLDERLAATSPGRFERDFGPRSRLFASELGSCARAVWWTFRHGKPRDARYEEHRGPLGHAVEDMRARRLAPILVEREVPLYAERVSGRVDFVVRPEPGGPQVPLELKSTYAFDWSMDEPRAANVYQLLWYVSRMPKAPYGLLEFVDLANYSGDPGRVGTLYVPRDDALVNARVERLWSLVSAAERPQCELGWQSNGCFDCGLLAGAEADGR